MYVGLHPKIAIQVLLSPFIAIPQLKAIDLQDWRGLWLLPRSHRKSQISVSSKARKKWWLTKIAAGLTLVWKKAVSFNNQTIFIKNYSNHKYCILFIRLKLTLSIKNILYFWAFNFFSNKNQKRRNC